MIGRRRKPVYEVEMSTGAQMWFPDPRDAFALCSRELMLARLDLGHARSRGELQAAMVTILKARMEASERTLEEYRGHLAVRTRELRECELVAEHRRKELERLGRLSLERRPIF